MQIHIDFYWVTVGDAHWTPFTHTLILRVVFHCGSPGKHFMEALLGSLEATLVLETQSLQEENQALIVHRVFIFCSRGRERTFRWDALMFIATILGESSYYQAPPIGCALPFPASSSFRQLNLVACWSRWNRSTYTSFPVMNDEWTRRGYSESKVCVSVYKWGFTSTGTGSLTGLGAL